jgi:hypothetical protein
VFQAKARFDPNQILSFNAIANGKITLKNALIKSAVLPHPLTVNGEVTLTQDGLNVEQIIGKFDQSQLLVSGFLPLFTPQSPIENPLTVTIDKGYINLDNLYSGQLDGQIILRGNALRPVISGNVQLANGAISLPQSSDEKEKVVHPSSITAFSRWSKPTRKQAPTLFTLDNFQIALRNLSVAQLPLYNFQFGGDLVLNGDFGSIQTIQPSGSILLDRGRVSFFDTRFLIDRRQRNEITFNPTQGLLNPDVNIRLRTIVSDLPASKRLRSGESNEIPDDSITKVQRVDIALLIKGRLSQLLPNLDPAASDVCRRQDTLTVINTNPTFSSEELERLTQCLKILAAQERSTLKELMGELLRSALRARMTQSRPSALPRMYRPSSVPITSSWVSQIRQEVRG